VYADLAILCALASSWKEIPVPVDSLVLGEVGLTGEVRDITDRLSRLREAARHGFQRVVTAAGKSTRSGPRQSSPPGSPRQEGGLILAAAASVEEAVALALQPGQGQARSEKA